MEVPTTEDKILSTSVVSQNYDAGYYYINDGQGVDYGLYLDLTFKQKLFDHYYAESILRVQKSSSNESDASVYIEQAEFTYLGSFFNYTVGRRDIRFFLSPTNYFGPFLTMGESQEDCFSITFPFRVYGDVPDSEAFFQAPYNALSLIYIPNPFSLSKSEFDGSQGLMIGQVHIKFNAGETLSDLTVNYAQSTNVWFLNSPWSDEGGVEASYKFNWPRTVSTYIDYSIQSLGYSGTTALVIGEELENTKDMLFGLADTINFEYQIPMGGSLSDPFTGGNPQNLDMGQLPIASWFLSISNHISEISPTGAARFHYGIAFTNNPGDYSFARLVEGSIAVPVAPGFGSGPREWDIPLTARDYQTIASMGFVGYEF